MTRLAKKGQRGHNCKARKEMIARKGWLLCYFKLLSSLSTGIWPPEYRSHFEHLEVGVRITSKHVNGV